MGREVEQMLRALGGAKWTRGEMAGIARDGEVERVREVLRYLDERGPRVIDWTDDREPCPECEMLGGHTESCDRRREGEDAGERRADLSEALEGLGT